MTTQKAQRTFPVVGNGVYRSPDYERVVRRLTDDEIHADLDAGKGDDEYRVAARAELDRRQEDE